MRNMVQHIIQKIYKDYFCFSEHNLCVLREEVEWSKLWANRRKYNGGYIRKYNGKNGESVHGSELFLLPGNSQPDILQPGTCCKEIKQETSFLGHGELHFPWPYGHKLDFDVYKQLRSYKWSQMDSQKTHTKPKAQSSSMHRALPFFNVPSSESYSVPKTTLQGRNQFHYFQMRKLRLRI